MALTGRSTLMTRLSCCRPRVEVGATLTGADVKADQDAHKDGCVQPQSYLACSLPIG